MRRASLSVVCFIVLLTACVPKETFFENSAPSPTATLDTTSAKKLVRDLLENNASCKLPCWWGITPGETTWVEARQILEKTSLYVGGQETEMNFYANVNSYVPYPHNYYSYLEHLYGVENGVVNYIRVFNYDLAPNYYLPKFLETFGQPSVILIQAFSQEELEQENFTFYLIYLDQGILVEYGIAESLEDAIVGEKLNVCLDEADSPFIHLWSQEKDKFSLQDIKQNFIDTKWLPEPIPLPEATGISIETFYETFKNQDTKVCFETPKSLWP